MRKRYITGAIAIGIAGLVAPAAQAASSPKANQATCFTDDSGSTCTQQGNRFTIVNDGAGEYGGVYIETQSLQGGSFSDIRQLSFTYSGDVSGGSPRFSIPILDEANRDGWVFIDAATCNDGLGNVTPLVDPTCAVTGYYWNPTDEDPATPEIESFSYDSWAAFLEGESASVVGDNYAYIVADQPGTVTVGEVKLGRTPPGKIRS